MLATVLLFVTNGHLLVIGGLLRTFRFLPVGTSPDSQRRAPTSCSRRSACSSSPRCRSRCRMIAVLFLADLGLALLTKVAPQLNAINVMFPAKIGLTLLLLGLSFPVLPAGARRAGRPARRRRWPTLSGAG